MTSCDLVLPCRDEAAALRGLLVRVPASLSVIVVDNGSTDGTAEVARGLGARVVTEPVPGYGAAVHAGVAASAADLVAVMDGDGSLDPVDVLPLVACIARGGATLAVGRRRPVAAAGWPWHARLGNAMALRQLRRRTGLRLSDIGPVRVCPRADLLRLGVTDRRSGYPVELLLRAAQAGWEVAELDVAYHPRAAGTRSKVSGSVPGTLRAALDFARVLS
jgi:glycosyltransferase involved in cell wall biosynthesis